MEISTRIRQYFQPLGNSGKKEKEKAVQQETKTVDIEHSPDIKDKINESNNQININDLTNPLTPDGETPDSSGFDDELNLKSPAEKVISDDVISDDVISDDVISDDVIPDGDFTSETENVPETNKIIPESKSESVEESTFQEKKAEVSKATVKSSAKPKTGSTVKAKKSGNRKS